MQIQNLIFGELDMQREPRLPKKKTMEMELVQLAKGGDSTAFSLLSEQYMPVLQGRAGRYSSIVGVDTEDFVQEGMLALYRAVMSFNSCAGTQFHTYAITCINNSMTSVVRNHMRNFRQQNGVHLDVIDEQKIYDATVQVNDGPEDLFFQMETANHRAQQIEALLSEFERHVLKQYLSGQSYQKVAKSLCTTTKAVDNALQRVRRKLRPNL